MLNRLITYLEIANFISKGEANFIGIIVTPWHYVGIQAAIEMLKNRGENILPLVVFGKHIDTGYAVDINSMPDYCFLLEDGLVPSIEAKLLKETVYYLKSQHGSSKDSVYLFSAWQYSVTRMKYFYSVQPRRYILGKVDEGVATYMNHRSVKRIITENIVCATLNKNINFNLFLREGNKLSPNVEAIKWYKKVLSIEDKIIIQESRKVLIATPCFEDRPEEDIELGKKIKNLIEGIQCLGFECVIKPHPRERNVLSKYSSLRCEIVNNSISLEEFLSTNRTISVISTSSTSLVTAKLFYDVKPVSMVKILDHSQFSKRHCAEMSSFERVFANVVYFPRTLSEVVSECVKS